MPDLKEDDGPASFGVLVFNNEIRTESSFRDCTNTTSEGEVESAFAAETTLPSKSHVHT
jgi:hypothetical protein